MQNYPNCHDITNNATFFSQFWLDITQCNLMVTLHLASVCLFTVVVKDILQYDFFLSILIYLTMQLWHYISQVWVYNTVVVKNLNFTFNFDFAFHNVTITTSHKWAYHSCEHQFCLQSDFLIPVLFQTEVETNWWRKTQRFAKWCSIMQPEFKNIKVIFLKLPSTNAFPIQCLICRDNTKWTSFFVQVYFPLNFPARFQTDTALSTTWKHLLHSYPEISLTRIYFTWLYNHILSIKHAGACSLHDAMWQTLASAVKVILWDNMPGTSPDLLNLYSPFPIPSPRQLFTSLCRSKSMTSPYPIMLTECLFSQQTPKTGAE